MNEPTLDEQIAVVEAAIVDDGSFPRQIKRNEIYAILSTLRAHAELEADARRYRYLRNAEPSDFAIQQSYPKIWNSCHGPEMDDAIDCAIERGPRGSK